IEPTALYQQILEAVGDIKPIMIGIASSANVYAGSEIERAQVQQFVGLMTRLAIVANGSVVLISHPSLTGISSESGRSGSPPKIVLRYQNGLSLPVPGTTSLNQAAKEARADEAFLALLRRFSAANRNVSYKTSKSYAPALFAKEAEAKKFGLT